MNAPGRDRGGRDRRGEPAQCSRYSRAPASIVSSVGVSGFLISGACRSVDASEACMAIFFSNGKSGASALKLI